MHARKTPTAKRSKGEAPHRSPDPGATLRAKWLHLFRKLLCQGHLQTKCANGMSRAPQHVKITPDNDHTTCQDHTQKLTNGMS